MIVGNVLQPKFVLCNLGKEDKIALNVCLFKRVNALVFRYILGS